MNAVLSRNAPRIDHRAVLARQQSAWASGDYAVAGNALQIVSEQLCENVKLCQDERVLDVAAGSFHAAMAAASRWCEVTATDEAEGAALRRRSPMEALALGVRFVDADAEALPFADQSFSAVISVFGVMFAPDQERAASEMIRVCRRRGRVGLASWTPDGFMGQLFATVARHAPQAKVRRSPFLWGTEQHLEELFGAYGDVEATTKRVVLRAHSPAEWVDRLRTTFVPIGKTFAGLDAARQKNLRGDLLELATRFNRAKDATMALDAEYLEVRIVRH
jgi:SAM-dependent methyltransferase